MKKRILFYLGIFFLIVFLRCLSENTVYSIISLIISFLCFVTSRTLISDRIEELEKLNKKISSYRKELEKIKKELENEEEKIQNIYSEKRNVTLEIAELNNYKQKLELDVSKLKNKTTIEYVDGLEGLDFEEYMVKLLRKNGYTKVEKTKASGDYGIDVLAEKDGIKYGIQCKNYDSAVGNKSVQEAYSGKKHYKCHLGIVATNNYFTNSAIELSNDTGIILWNRDKLIEMINYAKKDKVVSLDKEHLTYTNIDDRNEYNDPLYNEIVDFVIQAGKVSASLIQRKYRVGYNRATSIINLLEERGIIGPQKGSEPREVLIKKI